MSKVVPTGIPALDAFLKGGLPPGFCTLLLAPSGSGSEIFAKQFAGNHTGERVVFVSTDETEQEIRETSALAEWPMEGVEIHDVQSDFAEAMLHAHRQGSHGLTTTTVDPRALVEGLASLDIRTEAQAADYLSQLVAPFAEERAPDRCVVHTIDFYMSMYEVDRVIANLTALKATNARAGGQLLLVMAKGAHGGQLERRLELLADCLIELEMQRNRIAFDRFFLVRKVKNRPGSVGVSTYQVDNNGFSLETLERII